MTLDDFNNAYANMSIDEIDAAYAALSPIDKALRMYRVLLVAKLTGNVLSCDYDQANATQDALSDEEHARFQSLADAIDAEYPAE